MAREKFYDRVEFVASSKNDTDEEKNKIVIWNEKNGDLYLSICPESHNGGITIRFERSGGAKTRNQELMTALMDVYDAVAGNFKEKE